LINKITYVLIFLCIFNSNKGQSKEFDINNGNSQLFHSTLFSFGIKSIDEKITYCVYKLDLNLKIIDSLFIKAEKGNAESYLETYSDTLHNYLNIYFQKKEKKEVTILRFNKDFELIAKIENVDIARLNNTAMFSNETFYFNTNVYAVKTVSDTSGNQFYLNKYILRSETENFDYEFKWQFPFERKNIHSAHLFYADKENVFLFVTIGGGIKTGEWLLKIDATSGELKKATKLNPKGDDDSYFFGDYFINKNVKSLSLIGQKFTPSQFNRNENKLQISNAKHTEIYYLEIDSLGDVTSKDFFKIPINDIKTGVKKTVNSYAIRFSNLKKDIIGKVSFTGDIYKGVNSSICYLYSNTSVFNLIPSDGNLTIERCSLTPNLAIESYFQTQDKLDLNGKLCSDSIQQFETFFFKPIGFPVKQHFKFDENNNPMWVLSKHITKNNLVNYSFLSPVKKIYQTRTIEELKESVHPQFKNLNAQSFIISSQIEQAKYHINLYKW
jgi:hypothetical protein